MAQSFVYLLPAALGGVSNNTTGVNAIIGSDAVLTQDAWQCVNEGGDGDGDTSYVQIEATAGRSWRFKLQTPAEAGATNIQSIDQVIMTFVRRRANVGTGGRIQANILTGGVLYLDPNQPLLTTSYVTANLTFTTNPLTGQPWDITEFANRGIEIGVTRSINTGGTSFVRLSTIYLKLVYTVAPWGALPPASAVWDQLEDADGGWVSVPGEPASWTRVTS